MRTSIFIALCLACGTPVTIDPATDAGVDLPDAEVPIEDDAGADPDPDPDPDPEPPYPGAEWTTGAPEDYGLDSADLERAAYVAQEHGSYCLLVISRGVLVFERYFNEAVATDTHNSWSIAKSHSSTLIGIAIARGDIGSLDDRVSDYVPEWRDGEHDEITVRHLVTMTSGLDWSIWSDYVNMATISSNHTDHALDRGADVEPGSEWKYNNAGVQIIEPLIRNATGMTMEAYAQQHLWGHVGMRARWAHDRSDNPTAYANVLATCRDHARFGYLYLHGGRWRGYQVVPETWVRDALTPSQEFNRAYGYLFWLNGEAPTISPMNELDEERLTPFAPPDMFAARGFGNQFIDVIPSRDLIVVRFGQDPMAAGTSLDTERLIEDSRFPIHDEILRPILDAQR
jgi:CubicO group peptidase (beta-lactamase class C family)